MRVRFSAHARERLLERHGTQLTAEETAEVGRAILGNLQAEDAGTIYLDVILREGRLKFRAVVAVEALTVVTVLHFNDRRKNPKRFIREHRRDQLDRQNVRDMKRMNGRR